MSQSALNTYWYQAITAWKYAELWFIRIWGKKKTMVLTVENSLLQPTLSNHICNRSRSEMNGNIIILMIYLTLVNMRQQAWCLIDKAMGLKAVTIVETTQWYCTLYYKELSVWNSYPIGVIMVALISKCIKTRQNLMQSIGNIRTDVFISSFKAKLKVETPQTMGALGLDLWQ